MNGIESIDAALLTLCPPAIGIIVQERGSRLFIGHHHHTWPNLPGLPPPYLHTANDPILEVKMPWNEATGLALP